MTKHPANAVEERLASPQEVALVRWLLQHGEPSARAHLAELEDLHVVSRCTCGCASVDFAHEPGAGLKILSDYRWEDQHGNLFGVFVFAKRGKLAGLEVWSIDGQATPAALPDPELLRRSG
jgi:hypothetical protein